VTQHDDFHKEPIPGLPAHLPEGENILWQGKPERTAILRDALHSHKIGIYFFLLTAWKLASGISDGKTLSELAFSVGGTVLLGALALLILFAIAAMIERTTIYTITNKRVVMRFGIALPITFQFPFSQITSADVKRLDDTKGSVVFSLKEHTKISWLVLWPHVRGWKVAKPQPSLRAIADVEAVATLLATELSAAHKQAPQNVVSSAPDQTKTKRPATTNVGGINMGRANAKTA
jgi:hypothetical protein